MKPVFSSQFSIFNFQFKTLVLVGFLCKPNAVELARTAETQPKMGVAKMVSEIYKKCCYNIKI